MTTMDNIYFFLKRNYFREFISLIKTCVFIYTLFNFINISYGQTYYPIPMQNCYWEITHTGECTDDQILEGQDTIVYRLYPDGDTIINSIVYNKLISMEINHHGNGFCPLSYNLSPNGFVLGYRQDTAAKKVFMINPNQSAEILMYDFSFLVGDSLKTGYGQTQYGYRTISNIYYQSYSDGSCRKVYALDPYSAGNGSNGAGFNNLITEGIGNEVGFNNALAGVWQSGLSLQLNTEMWRSSFIINNAALYPTNPNSCPQSVKSIYADSKIKIYPNPARDIIRITTYPNGIISNHGNKSDFKIYDSMGELIKQGTIEFENNQSELNISELASGVYNITIPGKISSYSFAFVKM
jgi:hypothetical protein